MIDDETNEDLVVPCPFLGCGEEASQLFELPGVQIAKGFTMDFSNQPKMRCCPAHRELLIGWAGIRVTSW